MKKQFRNIGQAFTLIELLIVVAIIAILAAIAVPNFLEAQVRSKVSRTKADMRTMTTGLESYAVDANKYPSYHYAPHNGGTIGGGGAPGIGFFIGGAFTALGATTPDFYADPFNGSNQLTTPISYLTSIPTDVFYVSIAGEAPEAKQFLYVNWQQFVAYGGGTSVFQTYGQWRMTSGGPDLSRGNTGDAFTTLYDATNGTVSTGQIHRTSLSTEGIPNL